MITLEQYFGRWINHPDATDVRKKNAVRLLEACNKMEAMAAEDGVTFPVNPATGSNISGLYYGGFRPKMCPIGKEGSAHKEGLAIDRFDPLNLIDKWCTENSGKGGKLEQCGIYLEHPNATDKWSHWGIRPPKSGNRVYYP